MAIWSPHHGCVQVNIDETARDGLGPVGIDGVLHNADKEILIVFSSLICVTDSNDTEALVMEKALELLKGFFIFLVDLLFRTL